MKHINYFAKENNELNRDNYGYFANQSSSNWTLRTQRVGSWNLACGSYEPNSEKIPVRAWFGAALVLGCIFLAMFM
jgi:site-specific DNA-adenine methylase